jgi:hypothetical protein
MNKHQRPIFRKEAVSWFVESQDQSVCPRLACPSMSLVIWLCSLSFIAFGTAGWITKVPTYETGVIINNRGREIIVTSAEKINNISDGQEVTVIVNGRERTIKIRLLSPQDVLNLDSILREHPGLKGPLKIAYIEPLLHNTVSVKSKSESHEVRVKVATYRALAFIPWIGSYLKNCLKT